jgi:excisionase family DNA binding protein
LTDLLSLQGTVAAIASALGRANPVPAELARAGLTRTDVSPFPRQAMGVDGPRPGTQSQDASMDKPNPHDDDALLTPSEVAAMFRVNPKTVTRWARAGKISAIRTLGGHRRFRASEIRSFLEQVEEGQAL